MPTPGWSGWITPPPDRFPVTGDYYYHDFGQATAAGGTSSFGSYAGLPTDDLTAPLRAMLASTAGIPTPAPLPQGGNGGSLYFEVQRGNGYRSGEQGVEHIGSRYSAASVVQGATLYNCFGFADVTQDYWHSYYRFGTQWQDLGIAGLVDYTAGPYPSGELSALIEYESNESMFLGWEPWTPVLIHDFDNPVSGPDVLTPPPPPDYQLSLVPVTENLSPTSGPLPWQAQGSGASMASEIGTGAPFTEADREAYPPGWIPGDPTASTLYQPNRFGDLSYQPWVLAPGDSGPPSYVATPVTFDMGGVSTTPAFWFVINPDGAGYAGHIPGVVEPVASPDNLTYATNTVSMTSRLRVYGHHTQLVSFLYPDWYGPGLPYTELELVTERAEPSPPVARWQRPRYRVWLTDTAPAELFVRDRTHNWVGVRDNPNFSIRKDGSWHSAAGGSWELYLDDGTTPWTETTHMG